MTTPSDILDERTKVVEQTIENWDDLIGSRIATLARREADGK